MNIQFQEFSGQLPPDLLQRAYRSQGELAWPQADAIAAIDAYAESEATYRDEEGVQIVLIGADSLETIKKTHSHYFEDNLGSEFFESVVGAAE